MNEEPPREDTIPDAPAPPPETPSETPVQVADSDIPENLYKVRLEHFYGPLDLLLHLVREQELEISTISISQVADQYIAFIDSMQELDLDLASEFLVLAATLMRIKSRNLLPPEEDLEDEDDGEAFEEDPGFELIQRLLEYKKYKDRSVWMAEQTEVRKRRFSRPRITFDEPDLEDEEEIELDLWELVSQWARIASEIQHVDRTTILYTDIPIENFMTTILNRIVRDGSVSFRSLLGETKDKGVIIGNFLALLELGKQRQIRLEQTENGDDIRILPPDDEQRRELEEAAEEEAQVRAEVEAHPPTTEEHA